jgi:hypothetical protein
MKQLTTDEHLRLARRAYVRAQVRKLEVTPDYRRRLIERPTWEHGYRADNLAFEQRGVSPEFDAGEEKVRLLRASAEGTRLDSLYELMGPAWKRLVKKLHRTTDQWYVRLAMTLGGGAGVFEALRLMTR